MTERWVNFRRRSIMKRKCHSEVGVRNSVIRSQIYLKVGIFLHVEWIKSSFQGEGSDTSPFDTELSPSDFSIYVYMSRPKGIFVAVVVVLFVPLSCFLPSKKNIYICKGWIRKLNFTTARAPPTLTIASLFHRICSTALPPYWVMNDENISRWRIGYNTITHAESWEPQERVLYCSEMITTDGEWVQ